jgi:hypothetical protein
MGERDGMFVGPKHNRITFGLAGNNATTSYTFGIGQL